MAEITLDAGEYPIRVLWFESGFNAYFEVFGAEAGSQTFPLVVAGGAGRRDTQGGLAIVDSGAGGNIRIESIERDGATATVTWTSEPGGYYIVERSSSLTSGSWERLTEAYPEGGATGELLSFVDAEASLMNAYYRVASDSPPPYLSSGFETGDEGWVQVRKDGDSGETSWERGTPTAGPGAPFAGENVYGTNLAGDYGNGARLALRSPIIVDPNLNGTRLGAVARQSHFDHGLALNRLDSINGNGDDVLQVMKNDLSFARCPRRKVLHRLRDRDFGAINQGLAT